MGERGLSLCLSMFNIKEIIHGKKVPAKLLAGQGICMLLKAGNDLVIFYDVKYLFIHKRTGSFINTSNQYIFNRYINICQHESTQINTNQYKSTQNIPLSIPHRKGVFIFSCNRVYLNYC